MRIIIDMQGLQSPFSGARGVGRYTENLVKNLLIENSYNNAHEFFLALNGVFSESVIDIRRRFKGLIDDDHIVVWQQFYDTAAVRKPHFAITKAAKVTREIFLNSFDPDIIFSTNLQEGLTDAATTGVKTIPSRALFCSTIHDVVPFFYPRYTANPDVNTWYKSKIYDMSISDIVITVSEKSREQIVDHVDMDRLRITSIYNGVDLDLFHNRPLLKQQISKLNLKYDLPEAYFLYYGGCDDHKNLHRLIRAHARLDGKQTGAPKLVLAGRDIASDENIENLIASLNMVDQVVRLGFVPDQELPTLIKGAVAFIFPSLHEGFGLPALEAMACGVATLGSRNTSVAEIIGDDAAFFDGESEDDIAKLLIQVAEDPKLRKKLGRNAAKRASQFSWTRAARQLLALFDDVKPNPPRDAAIDPVEILSDNLLWELPALGAETKKALAHSVAESLTVDRKPCFYLDISTVVLQDDKSGIQRVTRAICKELLDNPPEGFDVVPVYSNRTDFEFRKAGAYLERTFGIESDGPDEAVVFQRTDILVYLDLNPGVAIAKRKFNAYVRVKGVKVYHIVYDLLPLLRPSIFWPELCEEFREWINVVSASDGAICISRSVADELNQYLSRYGVKRIDSFRIGWFHLGADISNSVPSRGLTKDARAVLRRAKELQSFLMVGTIEPRKGHRQTLAAFEKLWAMPGNENLGLFIVGRLGWGMHEFADTLRTHPEYSRRLFWLAGISDEYLERIYDTCRCLIAPSEGEGFGLPLIEAAQRGKPLIVRDIPVFREVAGEHAFFFADDRDPDVIAAAIRDWLKLFAKGIQPSSTDMPWLKWSASAAQLVDVIVNDSWRHDVESAAVMVPNLRLAHDSRQVKWKGFAESEANFRWTNGLQSSIEFEWDAGNIAHFRMLVDSLGPQNISARLNGVTLYSGKVDGTDVSVMFNMTGLQEGANILEFELPDARIPSLHDPRRVALAIRHFQIATPVHFVEADEIQAYNSHAIDWFGFDPAEDGFRWSIGHKCHLGFFWKDEPGQMALELGAVGYGRQDVTLRCNGDPVFSGRIKAGRPGDPDAIALECPVMIRTGFNVIEFDLPGAHAPSRDDMRLIAIAFHHFLLRPLSVADDPKSHS